MPGDVLSINHVIPHLGPTEICLYAPANRLYQWLNKHKEITRLNGLRHLGALSHALPGTRHARWDYTVALAYYAQSLDVPGMKSSFKLGNADFSSAQGALQTIALCWNIGHVPGIFPVEKGIYRFLHERNNNNPADELDWPNAQNQKVRRIRREANRFLREQDYLGVARVLAVIKLLFMLGADEEDEEPENLIYDFIVPFLLSYDADRSRQWLKLRTAFPIVRHLAYLTIDTSLAGLEWCPSIPSLFRQELNRDNVNLETLSDRICEVLSPVERLTYAALYHREIARRETAVVADGMHRHLKGCANPQSEIAECTKKSDFEELNIVQRPSPNRAEIAASIHLRSHFLGTGRSAAATESTLQRKGFPFAVVLRYEAWNAEAILEPDELVIDAVVKGTPTPQDVGRLIAWMIWQFEARNATPDDTVEFFLKGDLEKAYVSLLRRAFELAFPKKSLRIEPWPLARFGLFPDTPPEGSRGAIWACKAELDDPIAKHVLRDRSGSIPADLRDQYGELLGLRELRRHLRSKWKGKSLRQRCLLVTGSVRLRDDKNDLMEFDGGIAVVSSRGGRITWYGLESKRGSGDPEHSLESRLAQLQLPGDVHKLSAQYAFAKIELRC